MKKHELIAATSTACGYAEDVVRHVLDAAGTAMIEALGRHEEVMVVGLGKMRVIHRNERVARDIRRGTEVVVPAQYAALMRPSSAVDRAINKPNKRRAK